MSHPTTTVRLSQGTILTDSQREELLRKAIKTHFRKELSKLQPDDIERIAGGLAREMLELTNRCGMNHLQEEAGRRIELILPSKQECESIEELLGEIIEFRYRKGPPAGSKTKRFLKKTTGFMWMHLRETLGLPVLPPEPYTDNAVTGPRG